MAFGSGNSSGENMSVNITVSRSPGDKPGPDIVNPLIATDAVARARGRAEINHNGSSRKVVHGNGPKNTLMLPTFLVEIIKKNVRYRGILTMYSRSYNRSGSNFTIDSAVSVEVKIPDTRPKVA